MAQKTKQAEAETPDLPADRPAASAPTAGNPETDTAPVVDSSADVKTEDVEVVEFFGPGKEVTIRRITAEDWTRLGYDIDEDVDWRRENNWQVPLEHFGEDLRAFFNNQPDFRVVTVSQPV